MPVTNPLVADLARRSVAAQHARPVPSPCRNVCRLGDHGYCEGCYRTLDEIASWTTSSESTRRAVWRVLVQRARACSGADAGAAPPPASEGSA